jgi:nitroreductase
MAVVEITDRGPAGQVGVDSRVLTQAALTAAKAPSVFNSQPWRWRISRDSAQLWADRRRQVLPIDPDGRQLMHSCGAALHHLRVALAAVGRPSTVTYLPDRAEPDLLATVTLGPPQAPTPRELRLFAAIARRRTDRRPFAEQPVPDWVLDALRRVAESAGAALVFPTEEELVTLTVAAGHAARTEAADPAYLAALAAWVDRPAGNGDGIPATNVPARAARPVPVRDFTANAPQPTAAADPPPVGDRHARYAVLTTAGDQPADWLTAGEALSALLLTATAHGLATSPMSDLVEVETSRALLQGLFTGHPAIVVRIGVPAAGRPATPTPRRGGAGPGMDTGVDVVGGADGS